MDTNNASSILIFSFQPWPTSKIIRIVVLAIIMFVTLIGNIYIIYNLFFRHRRHRTRLHLFILNLAIGDLTICICTMTSELFLLIFDQEWILGNFACKLTLYIQVVTLASTTFINVAMTYDRYEAICCPLRSWTTLRRVRGVIILCWLSSLVVAIPQVFIFKQSLMSDNSTKYRCASTGYTAEWQRKVYFTTFALYVLVIPAVFMTVCFIKVIQVVGSSTTFWMRKLPQEQDLIKSSLATSPAKIKTVKLALTIIAVFVVCWTPYMVLTLIEIYSDGRVRIPTWLDGVLQTITLAQSSFNPFIYIIFNHKRNASPKLILALAPSNSQR